VAVSPFAPAPGRRGLFALVFFAWLSAPLAALQQPPPAIEEGDLPEATAPQPAAQTPAEPVAPPAPVAPQPTPEAFAERLRAAEQAYADGEYDAALAAYGEAAAVAPSPGERVKTLVTLANLQFQQDHPAQARDSLRAAVFLDPALAIRPDLYAPEFLQVFYDAQRDGLADRARETERLTHEGQLAVQEGNAAGGRQLLLRALEFSPNHSPALLEIATLDLAQGKAEAAIAGYERVVSLRQAQPATVPDEVAVVALTNLGKLYGDRQFFEDAASRLRQAVEIDSYRAESWFNLSVAQRALGKTDDALGSLLRARELSPGDEAILNNLARLYIEAARWPEATEVLAAATASNPRSARLWQLRGTALRAQKDLRGAEEAFRTVLTLDPMNRENIALQATTALAFLAYDRQDDAAVLAETRRGLGWKADDALLLNLAGLALQRQGAHEQALLQFEKAATTDPRRAETFNYMGAALFALARFEEAAANFERALAIRADYPEAAENLTLVRLRIEEQNAIRALLGLRAVKSAKPGSMKGIEVSEIAPNSLAARAGLLDGDLIVRVEDNPVSTPADFLVYLKLPNQRALAVEVLRQGNLKKIKLRLR